MNNTLSKLIDQKGLQLSVLYVEDDKEVSDEITQILQVIFNKVVVAYDGKEALSKYEKNDDIDLIITDIVMPVKNGIELINEIRVYNKNIPVIVISATSDFTYLLEAIALNVDGFIIKPIDYQHLMDVLESGIKKIVLEKENEDYKKNLEKKVNEKTFQLKEKYYRDELTGLKNRNSLLKDINNLHPQALSIIDINNFSAINDSYGYDVGDIVLKKVKEKLQTVFYENCNLYRVSSDQFVFMTYSDVKELNCNHFINTVHSIINDEFITIVTPELEVEIVVNVTIGIAKGISYKKLLESADLALQYAKKTKQHSAIFRDEIVRIINHKKKFNAIKLVKNSLQNDKIVPYFQHIKKNEEDSFESLVRIVDHEGNIVRPIIFLEEVKNTLYYTELTKTMITKTFKYFSKRKYSFSINLAFEDISNIHIIEYLKEQIEAYGVKDQLIIEILESESIDNFAKVKNFISEMRELGVRIAIDDFGSGYSNFSYIIEFEPDYIKIDGSIIKKIKTNNKSYSVVKTIIDFAHSLDIKVIAEYVSDKVIYDMINSLNIDGIQGYYIGKPSPSAKIGKLDV